MTAAERYLETTRGCHHQSVGPCVACTVAGLVAHAEAVKEEAAKIADADLLGVPGGRVAASERWDGGASEKTAKRIAQGIRAIEVS